MTVCCMTFVLALSLCDVIIARASQLPDVIIEIFVTEDISLANQTVARALQVAASENESSHVVTSHVHLADSPSAFLTSFTGALSRTNSNNTWSAFIGPGDTDYCDVIAKAANNRTLFVATQQCRTCSDVTNHPSNVKCILPRLNEIEEAVTSLLRRFRWQHVAIVASESSECAWQVRSLYILLQRHHFVIEDMIFVSNFESDDLVSRVNSVQGQVKG